MLHKSTEKRNAKAFILKIKLQINFPAKPLLAQHWMPELEYLLIYSLALWVLVQPLHYIPHCHCRSTGSPFQLLGAITIIQQRQGAGGLKAGTCPMVNWSFNDSQILEKIVTER